MRIKAREARNHEARITTCTRWDEWEEKAVPFLHCTPEASDFLRFSQQLEPEHGCFGWVPRHIYLTVAGSQEASGFNVRF